MDEIRRIVDGKREDDVFSWNPSLICIERTRKQVDKKEEGQPPPYSPFVPRPPSSSNVTACASWLLGLLIRVIIRIIHQFKCCLAAFKHDVICGEVAPLEATP